MTAADATDEVTGAIVYIEMQRQEMEKESGTAVACVESVRKLQEFLAQDRATASSAASAGVATANVPATQFETQRIQRMASGRQKGAGKNPRSGHQHHAPDRNGRRTQPRNN